jgi:hypothetical protein
MTRVRSLLVLAWTAACLSASPARASHSVFSASADRFEADGNAYGAADGVADFVDEFDDGTLAPDWAVLLGTAVESGGVMTLKNPGVDIALVFGVGLDISSAENEVELENGLGNFTITSTWEGLPALNTGFHFQIYGVGSIYESAGLNVNNLDPTNGSPAGYSIGQQVIFVGSAGAHRRTTSSRSTPRTSPGRSCSAWPSTTRPTP